MKPLHCHFKLPAIVLIPLETKVSIVLQRLHCLGEELFTIAFVHRGGHLLRLQVFSRKAFHDGRATVQLIHYSAVSGAYLRLPLDA